MAILQLALLPREGTLRYSFEPGRPETLTLVERPKGQFWDFESFVRFDGPLEEETRANLFLQARGRLQDQRLQRAEVQKVVNQGVLIVPMLGVTAVWGGTGSAKTLFADFLGRRLESRYSSMECAVSYIKFNEPEIMTVDGDPALTEVEALGDMMARFLLSDSYQFQIIDSIRSLVYNASSGATGKGGMNMSLFTTLTQLGILAELFGKSWVLIVNPLVTDDAALDLYESALEGSVQSVIRMLGGGQLTLTSRLPFWKNRNRKSYSFDLAKAAREVRGGSIDANQANGDDATELDLGREPDSVTRKGYHGR